MIQPNSPLAKSRASSPLEVLPGQGFRLERTKGIGPFRFLLVPGLVPDGPETFLRQKRWFLLRGDTSVATWPEESFSMEQAISDIGQFVDGASAGGKKPVLVGVSVGGGVVLEYLRRARESGTDAKVAGVILISPLVSVEDLSPLLRRLWDPIVSDDGDPVKALEKGRTFFRQLASRGTATALPSGWKAVLRAFTPEGIEEWVDAPVRRRIERTLQRIPPHGAIARCRALGELPGLRAGSRSQRPLTDAPTLILWGSKERHTLDMEGPGSGVLCRPDLAQKHFPASQVQWIYTKEGEPVPHASLLKHHKAFEKPLRQFLKRL